MKKGDAVAERRYPTRILTVVGKHKMGFKLRTPKGHELIRREDEIKLYENPTKK